MSSAGANTVRRGYELFSAGELERGIALTHPDIEIDERDALPGGRLYVGHDGVREWVADLRDRWSDLEVIVRDVAEAGNRVLATVQIVAQGAATGAGVQSESSHVWELDGDLLRRMQVFYDVTDARRAAGLL